MENKAKGLFHGKEGYNCAQAVLAAFQDKKGVSPETIAEFKACGGGRVANGYCGALHSALHLADGDEAKQAKLKDAFMEKAGSLTCKDIKAISKLPCGDCVGLAAAVLNS